MNIKPKFTGPVVLFVIDSLQTGGAELSLLQILQKLDQFEPVVVKLYSKKSELDSQFEAVKIKIFELDLPRSFWSLFNVQPYVEKFSSLQPVLIHSTLFRSDIFARNLGRHLNVPVINSLVNNTYSLRRFRLEPWRRKIKLFCYQLLDLLTAGRVDAFISNSETIKKSLCQALFIPSEKVRVIFRGRNLPVGNPPEHQKNWQEGFSAENKIIFLNVSRLLYRKGHALLIKSFAEFLKIRPNAILKIAGEGPERQSLEALVRELSISQHVQLLGTVTEVSELYRSSHFFVFPSHYEGLPGVLIEAMLARLPIIASDIPENKECVTEEMALFHRIGDSSDLAKVMLEAVKRTDWPERTMAAFRFAAQTFDVNNIAAQYEQYYEEVIQSFIRTVKN